MHHLLNISPHSFAEREKEAAVWIRETARDEGIGNCVEVSFVFNFIPLLSNILSYHLSSCLLPLSTQQQQGLTTNSIIKSEGWIQTMTPRRISSLKRATPYCNEYFAFLCSIFLAHNQAFVFSSNINLDEIGEKIQKIPSNNNHANKDLMRMMHNCEGL